MDRIERLPLPARREWRGPALGQASELLNGLAAICLHPSIVLPLFFAALALSTVTIGRAVALVLAAEALATAVAIGAAPALERRAGFRLGGLLGAVGLRALALLALAGAGTLLREEPARLLGLGGVLLLAAAVGGGAATALRHDTGTTPAAVLARARARWPLIGALATVVGALLARPFLERAAGSAPDGYIQLFLIAGLLLVPLAIAIFLLQGARDEASEPPAARAVIAAVPGLLVNNLAYGRLAAFRFLYAFAAVADPFYIVYAVRELGATGRAAGGYLLIFALARAAAIVVWRAVGAGVGNKMVLQLAAFVRLLAPITALTLPRLLGSATLRDRLPGGGSASLVAFGLVFVAYGIASGWLDLAGPAIEAGTTTPRERGAAAAVTHLALAVAAFTALLGGTIVDRYGYGFLFIAALLTGLAALLASGLVEEPGAVVLRAPQSERLPARRRAPRRSEVRGEPGEG